MGDVGECYKGICPITMKDIEFFDHTADVGIRLTRPSLETLFEDAALAMFHIIAPNNEFYFNVDYEINIESNNREELLVNWLSELNFCFQVKGYVPVTFDLVLFENGLSAVVHGDVFDPSQHNVEIEIKAVTYHKMYLLQQKDHWSAQIIFDI